MAQGYKDVKERSAIAKFRVKGEDAFILAWTTTPWTLPSNVALCVNAAEDYVKVESKGETYYLAAALCGTVLGEGEYTVLETFKGADLEGKEYEPCSILSAPRRSAGTWCATTTSPSPTAPAWCTSHRPSVRMTPRWAASTACPWCSWWTARAR